MEVTLAVLADYASLSQEGKLNVMGIFSEINAIALPFALPMTYLVVAFEAPPVEANTDKAVRLVLMDNQGKSIFEIGQTLRVPPPARLGGGINLCGIYAIGGLQFEHAGAYQLSVLIGGVEKRCVSLYVNEVTVGGA
jgi:hypothetical protein